MLSQAKLMNSLMPYAKSNEFEVFRTATIQSRFSPQLIRRSIEAKTSSA